MPPNVTIEQSWSPEPELLEKPPRRIGPAEHPDLNCPNVLLFSILGAALVIAGLTLFSIGMSQKNLTYDLGGLFGTLVGAAVLAYFPNRARQHRARAEGLVTHGVPVPARLLSADNLNGSVYARSIKYQVTLPSGELAHRQCNADDRALPKRIPSNITALLNPSSGDVDLYCVLPYRAIPKAVPLNNPVTPPVAPARDVSMGKIDAPAAPPPPRPKPAAEQEKKGSGRQSWE